MNGKSFIFYHKGTTKGGRSYLLWTLWILHKKETVTGTALAQLGDNKITLLQNSKERASGFLPVSHLYPGWSISSGYKLHGDFSYFLLYIGLIIWALNDSINAAVTLIGLLEILFSGTFRKGLCSFGWLNILINRGYHIGGGRQQLWPLFIHSPTQEMLLEHFPCIRHHFIY